MTVFAMYLSKWSTNSGEILPKIRQQITQILIVLYSPGGSIVLGKIWDPWLLLVNWKSKQNVLRCYFLCWSHSLSKECHGWYGYARLCKTRLTYKTVHRHCHAKYWTHDKTFLQTLYKTRSHQKTVIIKKTRARLEMAEGKILQKFWHVLHHFAKKL